MHELQFGFTKGGGCDKALLIFKTVVEYYNNHGNTVFVAALDLTKAYNRLNQCILVFQLILLYQGISLNICVLVLTFVCNCCQEW